MSEPEDPSAAISDQELPLYLEVVGMTRLMRLRREAPDRRARIEQQRVDVHDAIRYWWGEALDAYDLALDVALNLGRDFNHAHRPEAIRDGDPLIDMLTRLHARACLVAAEIRALLGAGHASGAMGRWRTLHEIAVTAQFIELHGADVARRYWQHGDIEARKLGDALAARYGEDQIDRSRVEEIKQIRAALKQRYGPEFDEPYGWAAVALNKKKPKFEDLERAVNLGSARLDYKAASYAIHAQGWGLVYELGLFRRDGLLAGPSDHGLDDPGDRALRSLGRCTTVLVAAQPEIEWMLQRHVLSRLIEKACALFESCGERAREAREADEQNWEGTTSSEEVPPSGDE